jgi:hypothetical protein
MTIPYEDTGYSSGAQQTDSIEIDPVPVYLVDKPGRRQAAHFGSIGYATIPPDSATNVPVQILSRRPTRDQAIIRNPVAAVNAPVILSNTLASLQQNPPLGFPLDSGAQVKLESQQPCYAIAAVGVNAAITIGVIDEAWETESGY